jgi:hypothetical protein
VIANSTCEPFEPLRCDCFLSSPNRPSDRGFVLSDHADWPGCSGDRRDTGAARVIVPHGYEDIMVRWLQEQGLAGRGPSPPSTTTRAPTYRNLPMAAGQRHGTPTLKRSPAVQRARRSTATNAKVDALSATFARRPDADAAGRFTSFSGGKPRQVVPTGHAGPCSRDARGIAAGCSTSATRRSATWPRPSPTCCRRPSARASRAWPNGSSSGCCRCARLRPEQQAERIAAYWDELDTTGRFLLTKLIGGGFPRGVSKLLVQRALAAARRASTPSSSRSA